MGSFLKQSINEMHQLTFYPRKLCKKCVNIGLFNVMHNLFTHKDLYYQSYTFPYTIHSANENKCQKYYFQQKPKQK